MAFAPGTELWGAEVPLSWTLNVLGESRCHILTHIQSGCCPCPSLAMAKLMHLVKPCPLSSAGALKTP